MQRCPRPMGFCLSAQKLHTKHSDSCWMHTDTHKQPSEKPSLHCFQTISVQLTRQPGRCTLGTYKRVCCVCLLPEPGWGECDLEGKVHGDVQRGESDGKNGPSPSLGPRAATLAHGMERKKAGIPTAARTMGRDEEALP